MKFPKLSPFKVFLPLLLLLCIETAAQSSQSINSNPPPAPGRDPGWGDDDVDDEAALPINGYLTLGLIAGTLYGFKIIRRKSNASNHQ